MSKTVRNLVVTAMLTAVSFILMLLDFSVPLIPNFVKMDISEFPALLAAFALGPVWGAGVCLLKNLLHLAVTTTGGVGELAIGLVALLDLGQPSMGSMIKTSSARRSSWRSFSSQKKRAFGRAALSLPINYYITYPFYQNFMPLDAIIGAYQAINPGVDGLFACLLIFNVPFTFAKGMLDVILCALIYKRISPLLKGNSN